MEERASGIILRTRLLTETSLIVQWLTIESGRISTVAKGARRPKSPFLGKLDLFYEADFTFQRSRRSDLHALREVSVRDSHSRLREELAWVHQGSYFGLLLEKSTEPESSVPELHELLQSALNLLQKMQPNPALVLVFELKLLCLLGYAPAVASLSPLTGSVVSQAPALSLADLSTALLALPVASKRELNRFLAHSLGTALGAVPSQREQALRSAAAA